MIDESSLGIRRPAARPDRETHKQYGHSSTRTCAKAGIIAVIGQRTTADRKYVEYRAVVICDADARHPDRCTDCQSIGHRRGQRERDCITVLGGSADGAQLMLLRPIEPNATPSTPPYEVVVPAGISSR